MVSNLILIILAMVAAEPSASVRIQSDSADVARVKVTGRLPVTSKLDAGTLSLEKGEALLRFCLVDQRGESGPPILGDYQVSKDGLELSYVPRYRLVHGLRYRITFLPKSRSVKVKDYHVPARKPALPPKVTRIFPTRNDLPANHLKFYIHFSQPMREGKSIFDRIHLLDADGERLGDPWRRVELWNEDATRLTLWIHPGRVKQGVNLRDDFGPVLIPGEKYTLEISAEVQNAAGDPLGKKFQKSFQANAPDHKRPLPRNWLLRPPIVSTRKPLAISFGESLDGPLLKRFLSIVDTEGDHVPGHIVLGHREESWEFTPDVPWRPQKYTLKINSLLEDLSGNTPLRVFDTDLDQTQASDPQLNRSFSPIGSHAKK